MRTETKSPSNSIASNVTNSMQNKVLNTSSFKNGIVSLISKSRIWVGERFVGQVMLHKRIKALTVLVAFVESWYTACEAHQLESPPWGCEVPGCSLQPFTERRRRSLIRARIASTPQTIVLRFWLHFSLSLFTYTLSHLRTPRAGGGRFCWATALQVYKQPDSAFIFFPPHLISQTYGELWEKAFSLQQLPWDTFNKANPVSRCSPFISIFDPCPFSFYLQLRFSLSSRAHNFFLWFSKLFFFS